MKQFGNIIWCMLTKTRYKFLKLYIVTLIDTFCSPVRIRTRAPVEEPLMCLKTLNYANDAKILFNCRMGVLNKNVPSDFEDSDAEEEKEKERETKTEKYREKKVKKQTIEQKDKHTKEGENKMKKQTTEQKDKQTKEGDKKVKKQNTEQKDKQTKEAEKKINKLKPNLF